MWHAVVIGEQLLGVFRQAVAAIAGADDGYLVATHCVISRLIRGFLSILRNGHATARPGEGYDGESRPL